MNANNAGSGVLLQINSGHGLITVGTDSVAAGYVGTGPGQMTIEIFAAPAGTSLAQLEASSPIATVHNTPNTSPGVQGIFAAGDPLTIPSYTGGALEFIAYAFSSGGTFDWWSTLGSSTIPTVPNSSAGPTPIFGTASGQINSFVLVVPEPTSVALSLVGAAGMLLFRHKK